MRPSELVRRGSDYLARHGVDSPTANAEELLMSLLGGDRSALYRDGDDVDPAVSRLYGRALCRRGRGVPLQHITRRQAFFDLMLMVGPGVFVPRPETEGLADLALEMLTRTPSPVVADVGTGTGAVALAIKHRRPDAEVVATDVSDEAVSMSNANARRLGLEVRTYRGDLLSPLPASLRDRLAMVVSNPPYVGPEDLDDLPEEVKADPREALVGGTDVHRRLADDARAWLRREGILLMEIGQTQGAVVADMLRELGYRSVEVRKDLAGRDRYAHGIFRAG